MITFPLLPRKPRLTPLLPSRDLQRNQSVAVPAAVVSAVATATRHMTVSMATNVLDPNTTLTRRTREGFHGERGKGSVSGTWSANIPMGFLPRWDRREDDAVTPGRGLPGTREGGRSEGEMTGKGRRDTGSTEGNVEGGWDKYGVREGYFK